MSKTQKNVVFGTTKAKAKKAKAKTTKGEAKAPAVRRLVPKPPVTESPLMVSPIIESPVTATPEMKPPSWKPRSSISRGIGAFSYRPMVNKLEKSEHIMLYFVSKADSKDRKRWLSGLTPSEQNRDSRCGRQRLFALRPISTSFIFSDGSRFSTPFDKPKLRERLDKLRDILYPGGEWCKVCLCNDGEGLSAELWDSYTLDMLVIKNDIWDIIPGLPWEQQTIYVFVDKDRSQFCYVVAIESTYLCNEGSTGSKWFFD